MDWTHLFAVFLGATGAIAWQEFYEWWKQPYTYTCPVRGCVFVMKTNQKKALELVVAGHKERVHPDD